MTNQVYSAMQELQPGAMVDLFVFDGTLIGADIAFFHGYTQIGPITWKGQAYTPIPLEAAGFDIDSAQPSLPTIKIANVNGAMSALCIAFQDMLGATVTRHRTFARFLDAANFGGVNPTADPNSEFNPDIWTVSRKIAEDNEAIEWELSNPLNIQGQVLPNRQIIANTCAWRILGGYRGPNCGYTGPAVADILDNPTTDPAKDNCGGRPISCKMRIWPNNELPYGGFVAAGLVRS
jgi:lambda family phage minor tail protein L